MAVVEGERNAEEFDTDAENTQDANDVKAVLLHKPHSRNTIVGLSLPGLSLIFEGQHCSKRNTGRRAMVTKKAIVWQAVHDK